MEDFFKFVWLSQNIWTWWCLRGFTWIFLYFFTCFLIIAWKIQKQLQIWSQFFVQMRSDNNSPLIQWCSKTSQKSGKQCSPWQKISILWKFVWLWNRSYETQFTCYYSHWQFTANLLYRKPFICCCQECWTSTCEQQFNIEKFYYVCSSKQ